MFENCARYFATILINEIKITNHENKIVVETILIYNL